MSSPFDTSARRVRAVTRASLIFNRRKKLDYKEYLAAQTPSGLASFDTFANAYPKRASRQTDTEKNVIFLLRKI
jgi:hypothetical protein